MGRQRSGTGRPAATTPRRSSPTASRAAPLGGRNGGHVGHLLHQIGHRLHGAHEVARRHIAHVTGGHAERRLERRPPGPRDHGGGQARGGLPRPRHQVDLLGRPDVLGHQRERIAAPPQIGQPFLAQPVGHRPSTAIAPDRWSPAPVPGQSPGAPGFEHHGGDHAGQDGGLGPVEELVGQRLGHQEIGLVVDAGQPVAAGRQRPVLDVVATPRARPRRWLSWRERRSARCACHWAKERWRTSLAVS